MHAKRREKKRSWIMLDYAESDLRNMGVQKQGNKSFGHNRMGTCHEGSQGQTEAATALERRAPQAMWTLCRKYSCLPLKH
jgi:hypothetical protein